MPMTDIGLTKAQLVTIVIDLINNDIIADISPSDLTAKSWIELFYIAIRHSKPHLDFIRSNLPDAFPSIQAYHNRFVRVQKLMTFFYKRPPIRQHKKFLKAVITSLETDATFWTDQGTYAFRTLKKWFEDYLIDITSVTLRATKTTAALKKYLSVESRFFLAPDDDTFDAENFDTDEYDEYLKLIDKLIRLTARTPNNDTMFPVIMTYLYSTSSLFGQTYRSVELGMPIAANFLPHYFTSKLFSDQPSTYRRLISIPADGSLSQHYVDNETTYGLNQFKTKLDQGTFETVSVDAPTPGNPFEEFLGHEHGLPNQPPGASGGPPPPTTTSDDPAASSTDNGTGSSSAPPPPPPPFGPPPPTSQPAIPDDSGYTPDINLARRIRPRTLQVQAQATTDLSHDHMTRFSSTSEGAISIANTSIRPGDIKLMGKTIFDQAYIVTYTRMSRKPIFNPITGRRR